jgi:transcriptional regulator with XRE-family HTH domain
MIKVEIKPELLSWARERAGFDIDGLTHRFPKLAAWEQGTATPTLKQIEKFATATHTPIGFLFLQEPPVETIPIPDFRTVRNKRIQRPSPDLLDMIYVCQQRQEWYRDFARSEREESLSFVGSASLNSNVESTAASMRHAPAGRILCRPATESELNGTLPSHVGYARCDALDCSKSEGPE